VRGDFQVRRRRIPLDFCLGLAVGGLSVVIYLQIMIDVSFLDHLVRLVCTRLG
jgi:hypothetical protein